MATTRRVARGARPGGRTRTTTPDLTWEAAQATIEAKAAAEKAGLEFVGKPGGGSPVLPEDPTTLDDSQLMVLFTRFVAWADFSASQLAFAEVDENAAKAALDEKKDIILIRHMPSSEALRKREETMTRVKAEVDTHADVVELQQKFLNAYALRKLLNVTFERYDRDAALLSRELTRRTGGQDPKQRRVSRWST